MSKQRKVIQSPTHGGVISSNPTENETAPGDAFSSVVSNIAFGIVVSSLILKRVLGHDLFLSTPISKCLCTLKLSVEFV